MKRRDFVKALPLTVLLPAAVVAEAKTAGAANAQPRTAVAKKTQVAQTTGRASSGKSWTGKLPDYAGKMIHSDMDGLGPDGKPTGQRATYTGASRADAKHDPAKPHQMTLTKDEQAIFDGKEGKEKAKLMKIVVAFGNIFGAEKLVKLGGAPHSIMFFGASYLKPLIDMFDECAKAGLKSYAPYTVNPRPYDVYNVQNNAKDMTMIYEGYKLQREWTTSTSASGRRT